jgi:hypothetical protein
MKLLPFAVLALLALMLGFASAQEPKGGMNGMNGMGMPGMGGHMHHPVQSMQGSGGATSSPSKVDERHVIELSAEERTFVLTEMRNFLESVQGIVDAVAEGRVKDAAEAARRSGMHVMRNAPQTMMGKMPIEFRKLGMDTHQRFAGIADEAAGMGDEKKVLKQLAEMLANCSACHQGYRIVVK